MSAQVVLQNYMFERFMERLKVISGSESLRSRWIQYTKDYSYAEGITYEDVLDAIKELIIGL